MSGISGFWKMESCKKMCPAFNLFFEGWSCQPPGHKDFFFKLMEVTVSTFGKKLKEIMFLYNDQAVLMIHENNPPVTS